MTFVRRVFFLLLVVASLPASLRGQNVPDPAALYGRQCARCHGANGNPDTATHKTDTRAFDFSKCSVASAEPDAPWRLAVAQGGTAVGLSNEMPAFAGTLTPAEIRAVVEYLRGLCVDQGWPNGNLNLPRPILTEKAFPEDEIVVRPAVSHRRHAPNEIEIETIIEKRFGKRNNVEVELPFASVAPEGARSGGLGDIAVAVKRVLLADRPGTRILSAGFEVVFPTGSESRGLGEGKARYEPFLAAGWRSDRASIQTKLALELPQHEPWQDREIGFGAYAGYDVTLDPKKWTVGLELNGANRALALTPQVRRALVKTGALAAAAGVRVPITERADQDLRFVGYVLWDYLEPIGRPRQKLK